MRTSTLLVLSLSTAATFVNAEPKAEGGGALQALLERMQTKKHQQDEQKHERRALKDTTAVTRSAPADYHTGTDAHHNSTSSIETGRSHKKVETTKAKHRSNAKATSSSIVASETVESKSRLRSTDTPPRRNHKNYKAAEVSTPKLERQMRHAESNVPINDLDDEYNSLTESSEKAAPTKVSDKAKKPFGKKEDLKKVAEQKKEDKRWVWGTAIIQDDTPATAVPSVGVNANLLTPGTTIIANTPAANLVAPSFPPLSPAAAVSSSQTTPAAVASSRTIMKNRKNPAVAPARDPTAKEKRWTWGSEIIQDGDENAPPVGENANLLSSGTTIAMTTPAAVLTPPSFPPLADATSSAAAAAETPAAAQVQDEEEQGSEGADQLGQVINEASSTLSAVAAEVTSTSPTSSIQALLSELQEQINALANAYASASTTSEPVAAQETSPAENVKRWVWGGSIIQDDTPVSAAPPVGENVNLLNPKLSVNTPAAVLTPPSFPPLPAVPTTTSVAGAKLAAVPAVTPTPEVVDSDSSTSTSTTTTRRNRKSEADSIRSARAAHERTAALEWHLAQKKSSIGRMARHKRQ